MGRGKVIQLARGQTMDRDVFENLGAREQQIAQIAAVHRQFRGSVIAGHAAAVVLGLPGSFEVIDLIQPRPSARSLRGARGRSIRVRGCTAREVVQVGEVTCTDPLRTGMDIALWYGVGPALATLEAAAFAGTLTQADVEEALAGLSSKKVRDGIATFFTPFSESAEESYAKLTLHRAGWPAPQQQATLLDESGAFAARVEFFWPEHHVAWVRNKRPALSDLGVAAIGLADRPPRDARSPFDPARWYAAGPAWG